MRRRMAEMLVCSDFMHFWAAPFSGVWFFWAILDLSDGDYSGCHS
jgi:hypothetical protein